MAERPVSLQKKKRQRKTTLAKCSARTCIIHFHEQRSDTSIRELTEVSYGKIKEIVKLRKGSEDVNVRMDEICRQIPHELDANVHGIHRKCYQNFTNISKIKCRKRQHTSEDEAPSTSKRRRPSSTSILFPSDLCLFCDKNRKKIKGVSEYPIKCMTDTAADSIQMAAKHKNDYKLLGKIEGLDLVAREAHYHNSCRREYTRKDGRNVNRNPNEEVVKQLAAHDEAFRYICDYIEEHIINRCNVERMTMLKEKYLLYLQEHYPASYNLNYKTYKLKNKLQKHFGCRVKFWAPNYRSELIYSDLLPVGQAVETAFEMAASEDRFLQEAAMMLRRQLIDAEKSVTVLPWPPTATQLLSSENRPPSVIVKFLSYLMCGKSKDISEKMERAVNSCAQDICYAMSRGKWKMAKHVLLGITLRHMTGSAELITLLNHFGHCQSYSQVMELETAICNQLTTQENLLPTTISPTMNNVVLHFSWDNFDLSEETPSGAGTTHIAHGIVLQETTDSTGCDSDTNQLDQVPKKMNKDRSIHYEDRELPPCFVRSKNEPTFTPTHVSVSTPNSLRQSKESDFAWTIARLHKSDEQTVPGWAGWVSLTGNAAYIGHCAQSIVDYMVPIHSPITDNSTVQQVLRICQQATKDMQQEITIVTFDLAVVMKAYSIMWQNPEEYTGVLVRIGVFHTICSYLGVIGKMMAGTGFEDIIIEAGVCASGSIDQMLRGKHYNRAMRVHKLMYESLERLLLEAFYLRSADGTTLRANVQEQLQTLIGSPCSSGLNDLVTCDSFKELYQQYSAFKDQVRDGELGKTATFWLNYMDKVALLLRFVRATKLNDLDLHIASLWEMCPAFFAYNHHNYARYLPVYLLTLMNMSDIHPGGEELLRRNGFSVSRSDVPSSRNPVDLTIEETINRHAKSHCGIIGFSRNPAAYNRWCITRHARAKFMQAAYEMADMNSTELDTHKEIRKSEITKSESSVQSLVGAINGFVNPFQIDVKDKLFCLSSGAPATLKIEADLLNADAVGEKAFSAFITQRLVEKSVSFHQPIRRNTLSTFATLNKSKKVTTAANKHIQIRAERNLFGQLVMLSEENDISLEKTLSYPLAPIPWALATADGNPVKTDKAKLLHVLEAGVLNPEMPKLDASIYIIDGNAVLQGLVGMPTTFEELAGKVFQLLPKVPRLDFVTDTYKKDSIKQYERSRRGESQTFLIKGPNTKVPRDWKSFMSNDSNKEQLITLLLHEWQTDKYAPKLHGRHIYFVHKEECIHLKSEDGTKVTSSPEQELFSSQEEADTRIVLHCVHAARLASADNVIIVRSPDTDVFLLLLKFSQDIDNSVFFDTGVANKRRLIDLGAVVDKHGADYCKIMYCLHVVTGCDTTSAFVRRGKLAPKKTLDAHPEFQSSLASLASSTEISEETFTELEQFVCCMYGKSNYKDINKLRYDMFKQRFQPKRGQTLSSCDGIDLSLLPPCRSSLHMHILRCSYQAYIWNMSSIAYPDIPSPVGKGWTIDDCGQLQIDWVKGDILPQELIDIMPEREADNDDDLNVDDIEINNLADIIYDEDS